MAPAIWSPTALNTAVRVSAISAEDMSLKLIRPMLTWKAFKTASAPCSPSTPAADSTPPLSEASRLAMSRDRPASMPEDVSVFQVVVPPPMPKMPLFVFVFWTIW
ncbi:hypothetical protein D3C72_1450560 [compost metagenome]